MAVLIRHLPRESATVRSIKGESADWSRESVLLAGIFQALAGQPHPEAERLAGDWRADKQAEAAAALHERQERERGG